MSKTPVLYAHCSAGLLEEAKREARKREMTLGGLIRQATVRYLGLPVDFDTQPPEKTGSERKVKKKLARQGGRS